MNSWSNQLITKKIQSGTMCVNNEGLDQGKAKLWKETHNKVQII